MDLREWLTTEPTRPCGCGCAAHVSPSRERYYRKNAVWFLRGHQSRGANHGNYKGGVRVAKGYVWVLHPAPHPRRTPRGYVKRCWLVVEAHLGRHLHPSEVVHHVNENKLDDAITNLAVTTREAHGRLHNTGRRREPRCAAENPAYRHDISMANILPLRAQKATLDAVAAALCCSRALVVRRLRQYRVARGLQ